MFAVENNSHMKSLPKIERFAKVAILSLSFAAPAQFPDIFELGLRRLKDIFHLNPVEFPSTRKLNASPEERSRDLIEAFERSDIKAIIATIGGDDQVTYIKNLPKQPFLKNPKPFFGYSDNTHFCNFLWLLGIPSYYGGHVMNQFGMNSFMDNYTVEYLKLALFGSGKNEFETVLLKPATEFNEVGLEWSIVENMNRRRVYRKNDGWKWNLGDLSSKDPQIVKGLTWGGCLECIDDMLRNNSQIPTLEQFSNIIFFSETCEEVPPPALVARIWRALGERGILKQCRGFLIGRAKAWDFHLEPHTDEECDLYRKIQYERTVQIIRKYNKTAIIILNVDFGHTDPQISLPYGKLISIQVDKKCIEMNF